MSEGFLLPGFDNGTGMLMLPWWAAAALAALLVVLVVLAMLRGGTVVAVGGLIGFAFLALVVTIVWVGSERVADRERTEERHALLTRAQGLAAQAAAPGSALGCLDAAAGETVEAGCERALFGSAEAVAGATAFTAARLALLSDGVDFSVRANTSYEGALPGLRRALEVDRFGFVAQVLASHYGCSVDNCDAFTLFRDTNRLAANLKDRPFDTYVAKYAASWTVRGGRSPVSSSGASPVPPGFNVPSAAAIPPVSIMVPEPSASSGGATASSGAAASGEPAAAPPPRRTAPRAPRPVQQANPNRPLQQPNPNAPLHQANPNVPLQQAAPGPPADLVPPAPTAPPTAAGNSGSGARTP